MAKKLTKKEREGIIYKVQKSGLKGLKALDLAHILAVKKSKRK